MKKLLTISVFASLAVVATSLAGDSTDSLGKDLKQPAALAPTGVFSDHEWQIDTFGQSSFGSSEKAGLFKDTAWGGGVGLNYFFQRNLGLGIDAAWLSADESTLGHHRRFRDFNDDRTTVHNYTASVILRLPIESVRLAPYVYAGGGTALDGHDWASAHAGAGLEYRLVPHKVGLFIDGRWTYLGDRFGESDLNFWNVRAGVRLAF